MTSFTTLLLRIANYIFVTFKLAKEKHLLIGTLSTTKRTEFPTYPDNFLRVNLFKSSTQVENWFKLTTYVV